MSVELKGRRKENGSRKKKEKEEGEGRRKEKGRVNLRVIGPARTVQ